MKTEDGQYTLKKVSAKSIPTKSAHPCTSFFLSPPPCPQRNLCSSMPTLRGRINATAAKPVKNGCGDLTRRHAAPLATCVPCTGRFSPDDKFSRQRVTLKKRFGKSDSHVALTAYRYAQRGDYIPAQCDACSMSHCLTLHCAE